MLRMYASASRKIWTATRSRRHRYGAISLPPAPQRSLGHLNICEETLLRSCLPVAFSIEHLLDAVVALGLQTALEKLLRAHVRYHASAEGPSTHAHVTLTGIPVSAPRFLGITWLGPDRRFGTRTQPEE